jgi:hypothetical protein
MTERVYTGSPIYYLEEGEYYFSDGEFMVHGTHHKRDK